MNREEKKERFMHIVGDLGLKLGTDPEVWDNEKIERNKYNSVPFNFTCVSSSIFTIKALFGLYRLRELPKDLVNLGILSL